MVFGMIFERIKMVNVIKLVMMGFICIFKLKSLNDLLGKVIVVWVFILIVLIVWVMVFKVRIVDKG